MFVEASLEDFAGMVFGTVAGEGEDGYIFVGTLHLADPAGSVESILAGHVDVHHYEVETVVTQRFDSLEAIASEYAVDADMREIDPDD